MISFQYSLCKVEFHFITHNTLSAASLLGVLNISKAVQNASFFSIHDAKRFERTLFIIILIQFGELDNNIILKLKKNYCCTDLFCF